jgi:hypothetical protein
MGSGCLVTVRTTAGGRSVTVGYLVAARDEDRAVKIVKHNIAKSTDEVVAVSRVSEELLDVLGVPPGNFVRADGQPPEIVMEAENGPERPAFAGVSRNPGA